MAGVSVDGGGGGRRKLDTEINMIPMIDLLMVTISFLLITAVWVQSSRLEASANVPGTSETPPCEHEPGGCKAEPRLHVQTSDPGKFLLVWKEGPTVVRSVEVPRSQTEGHKSAQPGQVVYPALAARVAEEWKVSGLHRDASDKKFDHAVVHAPSDMPYGDIVAVMDAVAQPKRAVAYQGKTAQTAAFEITFAMD
ncbi:MAG: biopolymer transporter ExbD [Labilithrix sp.]|nr:biopolymer transporter ExbD [Labilithrix sp.]